MSKKRCSRCGRVYPSSYRSCPYCSGKRGSGRGSRGDSVIERIVDIFQQHRDRIFLISTAVLIVIAIFGMILTRCSDPASKPAEDPKDKQQQEDKEPDPQPAADPLTLAPASLSLYVDETAQLAVMGGEGTAVWTSSDETIASVAGGVVTAKAPGTATVTASCGTESASCAVTVKEKIPDVDVYLNRTDFTLRAGENSFQMVIKLKENRKVYEGPVVWSSEDPSVVTVSETGLVERVGKGDTTITATIGEKSWSCIVRTR